MSALSELRKNKSALLEKVNKAMQGDSGGDRKEDVRFWKPTRDSSGNGSAVIRFLPPFKGDELPWVKVYSHAFKGPTGKWYINDSLTTIGQQDPVSDANKILWETGTEANQKLVRERKRKVSYISNILVIKDPANPANEGKVKLFKYGKKIHEMIMNKAQPTFEDEEVVFVYDVDAGANFRLRIKTVDGYPNYDSSLFDSPTALCGGDDEKIEDVMNQYHSLFDFVDPTKFKTYDQLKKELDRALGESSGPVGKASDYVGGSDQSEAKESKKAEPKPSEDEAPWIPEKKAEPKSAPKETPKESKQAKVTSDDEDDDMALFREMLGK